MFTRFDRIHEHGRQTDGQTNGQTHRATACRAYVQHRTAKMEENAANYLSLYNAYALVLGIPDMAYDKHV